MITNTYDNQFFRIEGDYSEKSAKVILPYIINRITVDSMCDFGCGVGAWLHIAESLGISDVLGLDGDYVDRTQLKIAENSFYPCNLEERIYLDKKYDIAISMQVAEHMHEDKAEVFVDNLCDASDIILFSAAIPFQMGTNHYNLQWPSYWIEKFKKRGFCEFGGLRNVFWECENVDVAYKNMFLFIKKDYYQEIKEKFQDDICYNIDCVQPLYWESSNSKLFSRRFIFSNLPLETYNKIDTWLNTRSGKKCERAALKLIIIMSNIYNKIKK